MPVRLDGQHLTIEDVVRVARHGEKVELAPEAIERITTCRAMLEKKIVAHEIMYGVNTGIGEFSEVVLTDEQVKQFQRYLIYNHAAGIGEPAPDRARARRHALAASTSTPAATPAAARRSPQTYVAHAEQGRDPGRLREGQRRRLRRPRRR